MHHLNLTLGILGAFLLIIWYIFVNNFKFYPFQQSISTTRITPNNEISITLMKFLPILQNLLIANEYLFLIILLLIPITIFFNYYKNQNYNNNILEIILTTQLLIILPFIINREKDFDSFHFGE